MNNKLNRRNLLSGAVAIGIGVSLSGCSDEENGTEVGGGSERDYPEGYNESGIEDFNLALGEDSVYFSQQYLQITGNQSAVGTTPDGEEQEQEQTFELNFDGANGRQLITSDSEQGSVEQYFGDGILYVRETQQGEETYQRREVGEVQKENAFVFSLLEEQFIEADMNSEFEDGNIRYTADRDSYPEDSPQAELDEISAELVVSEDEGLPQELSVESTSEQGTQLVNYTFAYEEITVEEPEWTEEAEAQTPVAEVDFEEDNGELDITLQSVENGDEFYVEVTTEATFSGGVEVDGEENYLLTREGEGGEGTVVTATEYDPGVGFAVFGVAGDGSPQIIEQYQTESE